jgi:predicted DsbA family dithiol-disulfide isomerase
LSIQIISDTICPFCVLGKKKIEAAVAKLPKDVKVTYDWRPFQLDPTLPKPGISKLTRYTQKFGKARMESLFGGVKENGKVWGVNFDFGGNVGNTVDSHRLVEFSKTEEQGGGKHTDALMTALFRAYFEEKKDLSSEDVLIEAAGIAGLPASKEHLQTFLRSDQLRKDVLQDAEAAAEAGISGVPHFIINQQYAVSGAQDPDTFLDIFKKAGVKTE